MNKNRLAADLGVTDVLMEPGKGSSVKEIAEYWGDASIQAIHDRVIEWKSKRRLDLNSISDLECL